MARFPGAVWKPLSRNFSPGARTAQLGLILHVQAGNGELSGWFSNPSAQASSTFWVSKTGQIYQYMEAGTDKSWAQAGGNALYDSVETEGQPTEKLTDAQITALAKLVRWEHETYGMPYTVINTPGQSGFGWHGMGGAAWGGHTGCPGDLRRAQMQSIINAAQSGTVPQEDDMTPDQAAKLDALYWSLNNSILPALSQVAQQVNRINTEVPAMSAAVEAMAASQGLDPATVTRAITDAVDKALADVEITLSAKEA